MRAALVIRLGWLLGSLLPIAARAATFTKPELTLEVPDGWVEVPPSVLQQFHAEMQRQAPLAQAPRYDYAFQAANGPPWLDYPYLLVKVSPTGRPSERDLQSLPTIDLNSKVREQGDAWSKVLEKSSLGQMRYDQAMNVVWLSSKSDVKDIGPVTGLSGMIPTERGFIELHAYARDTDFERHLPTFQKIIGGAKIAPDLRYSPHTAEGLGPLAAPGARWLAIALVAGAAIAILVAVRRRRKS